jgi:transposase
MSLKKDKQKDLFTANNILHNFLKEDDPMIIFSKNIYPLFSDDDFNDCYSEVGRNGISPAFLSAVTLLQWKESLSDVEASESCINRLDWKIALHIPIEQNTSFDPSTLCYFRKRLKENNKMSLIFDKIVQFAIKKDFIQNNTNQRIDATHIIKHVNRISTTDLLFRTVKCVVDEIKKLDKDYYAKYIPEYIKERYMNRFSSFGMSKEKRTDRQVEIVEDGLLIKKLLEVVKSDKLKDMKQVEIMDIIFKENVKIEEIEIDKDKKKFLKVTEIECPKQTIFEPGDPSVKLGKKGKKNWVGSKCHIIETAVKGEINLITGMIQQTANENDNKILEKYDEKNKNLGLKPNKIFTDSNYISAESIKNYKEKSQEIMGYSQLDTSKKDEKYKLDKFKVNFENKIAICPENKISIKCSKQKDGSFCIYFDKKDCFNCSGYKECVGESRDKKRKIHINKYYDILQERRSLQKEKDFKDEMKVRAQIESTICELVRKHGLRKAKYKGVDGRQLQFYLSGSALNVKRIIRLLNKEESKRA